MSIHIHAYSAFSKKITDNFIHEMKINFPDLFSRNFLISDSDNLDSFSLEMAVEDSGIPSYFKSDFIISLNNKEFSIYMLDIANLFKNKFRNENIILLLNGEDLM